MEIEIGFDRAPKPLLVKLAQDAESQFEELCAALNGSEVVKLRADDGALVALNPAKVAYVRSVRGPKERVGFGIG